MKYKVYFKYPSHKNDLYPADSFDIEGETLEELRILANAEIEKRGAIGMYSLKLSD